jgi:hypothetical protein
MIKRALYTCSCVAIFEARGGRGGLYYCNGWKLHIPDSMHLGVYLGSDGFPLS